MIELLGFSKKYQTPVVDIPAWTFQRGIYLLKGANGSGKSTLLQSMAGRLSFKGNIMVNGHSLKKTPRICRQLVSYAAGEPMFPGFLTGGELVQFFQKTKGISPWPMGHLLEGFEAPSFLESPIQTYSSGMLKKLALLLAFTGNPDWILLDEPFNGLDNTSVAALEGFVTQLYLQYKVSFIIASHQEHPQLMGSGNELLVLENKQLRSYDPK